MKENLHGEHGLSLHRRRRDDGSSAAASLLLVDARVRDRVFWTLPSSTYRTPSSRPIWRASIDLSLYA